LIEELFFFFSISWNREFCKQWLLEMTKILFVGNGY